MADGNKVQLAVIGAGPGGYAAAFQAAELGLDVALITADVKPGGVCLLRGCIPSKALLHVAKLIEETRHASQWGITFGDPQIDLDKLRSWKQGIVEKLAGGVEQLASRRNVRVMYAHASFADAGTLRLEQAGEHDPPEHDTLQFDQAIIASGSVPAMPGMFRTDDGRVMDSSGALNLHDIPQRLLVVGGGYIGLEMGSVYAALGSQVTVVELLDGLLPGADRDLVRPLEQGLKKKFEAIHLETKVTKLDSRDDGVAVTMEAVNGSFEETFDRVLVSVGRRPVTEGLGLEHTGVQVNDKGFIVVDEQQRTAEKHIFAIGDVAGEPMLAHKASREGKIAAEVAAGHKAGFDNVAIPAVVFTDPEVAWCGLTERDAKEKNIDVTVAKFPWGASGRATTLDRSDGVTKLLIDPKTERILGVGITGPGAGELIAEGVLAVEMAAVVRDVADSIHAHPTLSETVMEAGEAYWGQATHMYRPKK